MIYNISKQKVFVKHVVAASEMDLLLSTSARVQGCFVGRLPGSTVVLLRERNAFKTFNCVFSTTTSMK